ncbi:MAG: GntR family transcriptional regulator [Parvibaculaceae bacterium]
MKSDRKTTTNPKSSAQPTRSGTAASMTEQAYARLEEMLATLELPPGSVVSEAELCAKLGIGRTPVREAMQQLARERLLQILPRRGCIVSECKLEDELNIIEVRRPLEQLVNRAAALRATPAQRVQFTQIADAMKQALAADCFDDFARLDVALNHLCLASCRNATAATMMRQINGLNRRFWFTHHGRTLPREGVESHIAIAQAIANADADAATEATARLLRYVEQLARKSLSIDSGVNP